MTCFVSSKQRRWPLTRIACATSFPLSPSHQNEKINPRIEIFISCLVSSCGKRDLMHTCIHSFFCRVPRHSRGLSEFINRSNFANFFWRFYFLCKPRTQKHGMEANDISGQNLQGCSIGFNRVWHRFRSVMFYTKKQTYWMQTLRNDIQWENWDRSFEMRSCFRYNRIFSSEVKIMLRSKKTSFKGINTHPCPILWMF